MDSRYWFVLFLPAALVLLYVSSSSTDFSRWLGLSPPSPIRDSQGQDMVLSELRTLALLQHQESGLLRLLNSTTNNNNISISIRGEVLEQIRLNRQIQQKLLSSHTYYYNSSSNPTLNPGSVPCSAIRRAKYELRKPLKWKPLPNRYLLAVCTYGQFSDRLACVEKHMFLAALLRRTLILPSPKVDYNYERVLDVLHIQSCLSGAGNKVVLFDEFAAKQKGRVHINRFLCYFPDCGLDKPHEVALRGAGVSWGKKEYGWPNNPPPNPIDAATFTARFNSEDQILCIGDVFLANVEPDWVSQFGGPLAHSCQSLIEPHSFIKATAQRFVQTFLGKDFVALHFRRYEFLTSCNKNNEEGQNCHFYPVPQVANCVLRKVSSAAMPLIYLSTDAEESETNLLQSLLILNGATVPLVQRPKHSSGEKWDSPLARHRVLGDKEVIAMLDKTICAMSSVFIAAPGSAFSDGIIRLRREWGLSNTCDEYVCQGEDPTFVAGLN